MSDDEHLALPPDPERCYPGCPHVLRAAAHRPDVLGLRERAEAFREAVLEVRYIRGRLTKVTVEDFMAILTILDSPEARSVDAALAPQEAER